MTRGRFAALAACLAIAATAPQATASAAPASGALASSSGCITRLPIVVTVPSRFTATYRRVLPVNVTSRVPRIRHLRISLYTFNGDLIGRGTRGALSGSAVVRLHLRYPLQPGEYTIYSEGEPNADPSCGPKTRSRVVRFRGCIATLPVDFPNPPGGTAADYGGFLSFAISSEGPLIRRLRVSVSDATGRLVGAAHRAVLFGTVTIDVRLRHKLQPGAYTVDVRGSIDAQPRSCGPKHALLTLTFG